VVEDAPIMRDLLARILVSEGFGVARADDAVSVFAQFAVGAPDLVLLDADLSGESGFDLCAKLKSHPETSEVPVIFLSAQDDPVTRIAGFDAGGVDYISKPFVAREVLARVRVHLRLRDATECMRRNQRARIEELRQAQQSILVAPEEFPEGSFAVAYEPLDAVGGDFYDVVPLRGGAIGYFVADISGHGVAASFLTAAVKALLRHHSGPLYTPEDTMRDMNATLRATLTDAHYVTACYARLSRSRRNLSVVSAGHPPPILTSQDGESKLAKIESDPLGVFGSVVLHKLEIEVMPGDRFYLYTDGLVEDWEQPAGGRSGGIERLRAACGRRHDLSLTDAIQAIVAEVRPKTVEDDLLLLGVEVPA